MKVKVNNLAKSKPLMAVYSPNSGNLYFQSAGSSYSLKILNKKGECQSSVYKTFEELIFDTSNPLTKIYEGESITITF
jgi:hypothetical protein